MEQNFKSSFIPKKNVSISTNVGRNATGSTRRGKLDTIAGFLFALTLLGWAGLFGYQKYVEASITSIEKDVIDARARIDNERLDQFRSLGKQVKISKEILNRHIVATPIFETLEDLTVSSVRFTNFSLLLEKDGLHVMATAVAKNFATVELQANALRAAESLTQVTIANVTPSADRGEVMFDVAFVLPREQVLYTRIVENMIEESRQKQAVDVTQSVGVSSESENQGVAGPELSEDIVDQIFSEDDLDDLLQAELESL